MNGKVIFVAGVHGVGKTTLCKRLSSSLDIPAYSAGDLISAENGEEYVFNKIPKDKNRNQYILIKAIDRMLKEHSSFLLAGHFCLLSHDEVVDVLPVEIFESMSLGVVVLLEADTQQIANNLVERDRKTYALNEIIALQRAEKKQAQDAATALGLPLLCHKMRYDGSDIDEIVQFLRRRCASITGYQYRHLPRKSSSDQ